jgi:hypothetical protein
VIRGEAATRDWRPQEFGRRHVRHIDDPLIEPVWVGLRVLAHVTPDGAELIDEYGDAAERVPATHALQPAVRARSAVLDGYLTLQPVDESAIVYSIDDAETPTSSGFVRQAILGSIGETRREAQHELEEVAASVPMRGIDPDAAFVAVDLLLLDDESLLDIPLLERKRLLESVVEEGPLVRIGIHVRPPIGPWMATWRAAGFRSLAYKHANSRYRPGEPNDDWATIRIPAQR